MWTRYDPAIVRQELQVLAEHGLTMTRSFFYWPDFHPTPDTPRRAVHRELPRLPRRPQRGRDDAPSRPSSWATCPGRTGTPAWRDGRDLYSDVWFVGRQAWYVRELIARVRRASARSPAGCSPTRCRSTGARRRARLVTAWASLLVDAVRAGGGTQPVSVGDGAWGIETTGHDNGFSSVDSPPSRTSSGRTSTGWRPTRSASTSKAAYIAELCRVAGLPVIMEEFGLTSDFVSPSGAHRTTGSCSTTRCSPARPAGSPGTTPTTTTSSASDRTRTIRSRCTSGSPTPPARRSRRCSSWPGSPVDLAAIDVASVTRSSVDAALVVPSHLAADYPFTQEAERALIVAAGEQAYVAAHEAHVPVAVVREEEDGGVPSGYGSVHPAVGQAVVRADVAAASLARFGRGDRLLRRTASATSACSAGRGGRTPRSCSVCSASRRTGWSRRCCDDVVIVRFVASFGIARRGSAALHGRRQRA